MQSKKPQILLVDDSISDARIFAEIVRECGLEAELDILFVSESSKAWSLLNERKVLPDLILLDLKLPNKGGNELLADIKAHTTLRTIPVIIMTTSDHQSDVDTAYENYANAYIIKPAEINEFISTVKNIYNFWFQTALLKP
jgi:chemotaxis family two-component system response regulator Rcp1